MAWSRLARMAAIVFANSTPTAHQPALAGLQRAVRIVPNGVDLRAFPSRAREPAGPPTVGMAAHLTPWKGHLRFLRVVAALREQVPDLRARIAGGAIYNTSEHAAYRERLAGEIRRLGLPDVCIVEVVAPEAMPAWLSQLTLLLHCPDRPEPFGRVLVEAMASGVPVVAASGESAPEVVGEAGLVVPLADDGAIREAALRILGDGELRRRLAVTGRRRAEQRFAESECADRVADDATLRLAALGPFVRIEPFLAKSRVHAGSKSVSNRHAFYNEVFAMLKSHYGYVPYQWVQGYASCLIERKDQFFSKPRHTFAAAALALVLGSWINRRRVMPFFRDWLAHRTIGARLLRRREWKTRRARW